MTAIGTKQRVTRHTPDTKGQTPVFWARLYRRVNGASFT